ncbi:polyprenyl synthetase family protein [[Clostridium] spiroforme]|nr:polyprenyl synthetase family protein [Thomasclavelia spiroformis]
MDKLIIEINERLKHILDNYPDSTVKEAMLYSLNAGGKRIRPVMLLQVVRSYGLDYHDYLDIACALEMIHTYSLIHDDLPGMDNDDLRRGRPTCHKQFNEAIAILAGDGLLNEAVNIILQTQINNEMKIDLISCLYRASGIGGMIYGQELDIQNENQNIDLAALQQIHHYKTGQLLSCALMMGAIISCQQDIAIWQKIGLKIGLAFQIQDDVLDVTATTEQLGKPAGSDESNHKTTYVHLLGIEGSQNAADQLLNEATELLYSLRINHGLILEIIEKLRKRVS